MSCLYPYFKKNANYPMLSDRPEVPVPCGKCPTCLQRRAAEWCFRIRQESNRRFSASFITLTYLNPPMTPKGFMTLHSKHLQLFWKRLRRMHPPGTEIKYYAVGEYGSKGNRPHYHAIVFGHDPSLIESAWVHSSFPDAGRVSVDECNEATVAYVCKYLHKGKMVPAHENDDRMPERSWMSQAIGSNYLTDAKVRYHRDDVTRTFVVQDGFKKAMPRYYRNRIYDDADRYEQSLVVQDRSIEAEASRKADYVRRTGSVDGYEDYVRESRKAMVLNFKKRAAAKRRDI